jgi:hypothetical protein
VTPHPNVEVAVLPDAIDDGESALQVGVLREAEEGYPVRFTRLL